MPHQWGDEEGELLLNEPFKMVQTIDIYEDNTDYNFSYLQVNAYTCSVGMGSVEAE